MRNTPVTTILLFFTLTLSSQTVTVSEGLTIRNDLAYDIVGKLKDRILLFRDKQNEYEIQAFDEKMQLSWSKELEFDKKNVDIVEVVSSNEDFHIIYQYKKKGDTYLKINRYDPAANLRDSALVKDFGHRFNAPKMKVIRSEDKSKVLLYNIHEQKEVEAFSFDLNSMTLLWEKSFTPKDWYLYRDFRQILVSDAGQMFFIIERDNRKPKKKDHRFEIFQMDQNQQSINRFEIPVKEHLTYDIFFTYDNINHNLVGAGLYSENNRGRANGFYYLRIPADRPENFLIKFNQFDKKFVSTVMDKKTNKAKGISEADVKDVVLRRDGGIILIGERNKIYERRVASTTRTYSNGTSNHAVDYYYDDIFAISIHPNGKTHWKKILHKRQFSQDDDAIYSSFFLFKTPSNLRLLFNDEIKHENTVSEYVLSSNGHSDRNSIFSTENQQIRLRFKDSQQVASNEILVPSERRHKLKLVRVIY